VAKIFGYNGPSWLVQAGMSQKRGDAKALERLLSPQGKLFMAIHNADSDGTIQFHFPKQRLPSFTQIMLSSRSGGRMAKAWPQYAAMLGVSGGIQQRQYEYGEQRQGDQMVSGHLHVSVFQYFCYWFAFYAIRGSSSVGSDASIARMGHAGFVGTSMKRAVGVLHLTKGSRMSNGTNGKSLYTGLLRGLLSEFLPRPMDTREYGQQSSTTSGHGLFSPVLSSYQPKPSTGVLMYSILLEFWLKDSEESIGGDVVASGGDRVVGSRYQRGWSTSYEPPSEDLLEAIDGLTRYIYIYETKDGMKPAQDGQSWLPTSPVLYGPGDMQGMTNKVLQGPRSLGVAASLAPQAYARQLYRLFYRAFVSWPDQRTIKPLLRVFLSVLAPWRYPSSRTSQSKGVTSLDLGKSAVKAHMSDLAHFVGFDGNKDSDARRRKEEYSEEWEHHVLSHLPFYLDLVPLFLELSISRVGARGETSVADVKRVMDVFYQSESLVALLRDIEFHVNKCYSSQPMRAEGSHAEIIPWIIEQATNWRSYALPVGSQSTQQGLSQLKLYALFSEQVPCAAISANDILCISSGIMKSDAQQSFDACLRKVLPLSSVEGGPHPHAHGAMYPHELDGGLKLPKNTWKDVKFKGDPLHVPKTSYEVKYLVDATIRISQWLNSLIGLDTPLSDDDPENIVQELIFKLKRKGWKINLRPVSDIRNVFWTPVLFWMAYSIVRLLHFFIKAIMG